MQTLPLGISASFLIGFGIYWLVYSVVLLILMKVQGWHVKLLPLLGSTALATVLAQIPIVGPYIATAVLAICIWKASGSDLTDSIFSVVIAGALMFAFQIFALTAIVGEIHVPWLKSPTEGAEDSHGVLEVPAANSWDGPNGDDKALLYLKGITVSSNQTMVLVGSGTANYSFTNGEHAIIRGPKGRLVVVCEAINTNDVIMRVDMADRKFRLNLVLPP